MNYYIKWKNRKVCQNDLHIGKSTSSGFLFKEHEEDSYYNIPSLSSKKEWIEFLFLNDNLIYNEENKKVSFLDFVKKVKKNKNEKDYLKYKNYYKDKEEYLFDKTDFS